MKERWIRIAGHESHLVTPSWLYLDFETQQGRIRRQALGGRLVFGLLSDGSWVCRGDIVEYSSHVYVDIPSLPPMDMPLDAVVGPEEAVTPAVFPEN